jgi:hypothetical protein
VTASPALPVTSDDRSGDAGCTRTDRSILACTSVLFSNRLSLDFGPGNLPHGFPGIVHLSKSGGFAWFSAEYLLSLGQRAARFASSIGTSIGTSKGGRSPSQSTAVASSARY